MDKKLYKKLRKYFSRKEIKKQGEHIFTLANVYLKAEREYKGDYMELSQTVKDLALFLQKNINIENEGEIKIRISFYNGRIDRIDKTVRISKHPGSQDNNA